MQPFRSIPDGYVGRIALAELQQALKRTRRRPLMPRPSQLMVDCSTDRRDRLDRASIAKGMKSLAKSLPCRPGLRPLALPLGADCAGIYRSRGTVIRHIRAFNIYDGIMLHRFDVLVG